MDGRKIYCAAPRATNLDTLRQLFLNLVLPMAMSLQGRTCLHASAIATQAGAVAFVGDTGIGKSTLAASLGTSGHPVLTDDCLAVIEKNGRFFGAPGCQSVRLWPAAIRAIRPDIGSPRNGNKRRVKTGKTIAQCGQNVPLSAIYILAPSSSAAPNSIRIADLAPGAALIELSQQAFRLDRASDASNKRELAFLARLAETVPVRKLIYFRSFRFLAQLKKMIQ